MKSRRGPALVVLVVCLTLVAIGVRTLLAPRAILPRSDLILGTTLVVGFGILAVVAARAVLDRRPRLVIDDSGIADRTLGLGTIPWTAIRAARPFAQRNFPVLCLELHDAAGWTRRLSPLRRVLARRQERLGLTPFVVNLLGTRIDPARVAELVAGRVTKV